MRLAPKLFKAADTLANISLNFQTRANQLAKSELNQAISQSQQILNALERERNPSFRNPISAVKQSLQVLQARRRN